ncbi:MAG: amino acid-binding protein [Planctomycetes bacterium]|nr:amino acid-binding protein [Planctomycetota bacterium]
MTFEITKVDVWVAAVEDQPGELARKLEAVVCAGANLDFIVARPMENQPSTGVLYLAPVEGEEQCQAAESVGLRRSSIHVLRVEGPDRPGLAACIARSLAEADVNICGMTAAAIGERGIVYVRLDSEEDVVRAGDVLAPDLA